MGPALFDLSRIASPRCVSRTFLRCRFRPLGRRVSALSSWGGLAGNLPACHAASVGGKLQGAAKRGPEQRGPARSEASTGSIARTRPLVAR